MDEIVSVRKKITNRIALRDSLNILGVFLLVTAIVLAAVGFSSNGLVMIIAGAVILIVAMVLWLVVCEKIAKKLAELKVDFKNQNQKYYLENALTKFGCKRSHYIPEKGLWKDEVVRSGIFGRDSSMTIRSDSYLEGEYEEKRFRTANLEIIQAKPYAANLKRKMVNGQFWIFTSEIEFPCKLMIFDRDLYSSFDRSNALNQWCEEDGEMKLFVPTDERLNTRCICFSDRPEQAGHILTGTAVTRIMAYASNHPGEVFFISFNYKEMYFFDYAEVQDAKPLQDADPDAATDPKKFLSHKDISTLREDMKDIPVNAQTSADGMVTYLTDIMDIFVSDRVMRRTSATE